MKKSTISILAIVMGVSFVGLLILQMQYIEEIIGMRKLHFDESVSRSLYQVSRHLEVEEGTRYLEQGAAAMDGIATAYDSIIVSTDSSVIQRVHKVTAKDGSVFTSLETTASTNLSDKYFTKQKGAIPYKTRSLQEIMKKRYDYDKKLLDEVIYSMLYTASDRPLEDRIDFNELDQKIKTELNNNGINIDYHFSVQASNGRVVYRCSDYDAKGEDLCYTETLFKNDPVQKMGVLKVHFPEQGHFIYSSIMFITLSILFTLVLLVTFIITLVLVFRQKKLTEVKNDFINNMTHEFKTPISSISLAAQMLSDPSVKKTPQMLDRLTSTINDETKRLRFQVEKVLQLSMYDHREANLKMRDIDANELISGVIHTFALKVEKNGGKIISNLKAEDPIIYVDDMHFTNVIFNLMDNAVKYKRNDIELELKVSTWNEGKKLCISIQDNGIGIKKDDLKKIFEKFYRVHTGNLHDVKGFGLGLAYVKKIILNHQGTIYAESELGIGTKFIIKLPLLDD
ncbi:MAG: HAMP domain-containing histidine kinase [Bacteroides sp.]|nr:HAMP domain-containing histidine kinase [Roseburia sp.]MCM1345866.1 HAMP domain-containing histidine kinase [Bacteroides sp.]MCM1421706.1 HAMP domain-containing histidine kinase [Bacteroides sp.]